ncbi:MAG: LptE family protein [Acidobacteriaceae bacterium]|nr:LptE family protein [Acidobacteriaceae bacterium]
MKLWLSMAFVAALLLQAGCGYHVSGNGDLLPKTIHSIAIPAFNNATTRYRLTDTLPEALAREFIARTHYRIVPERSQADAVLEGTVITYIAFPTTFDQTTGRASGLQANVRMTVSLVERGSGKVLFTRPSFEWKQQYEINTTANYKAYFDESETAMIRLSRDVARDLVTAILENF